MGEPGRDNTPKNNNQSPRTKIAFRVVSVTKLIVEADKEVSWTKIPALFLPVFEAENLVHIATTDDWTQTQAPSNAAIFSKLPI